MSNVLWRRFFVALVAPVGLVLAFVLHGCVSEQPPWNYGERVTGTEGTTSLDETSGVRGDTSVGVPSETGTSVAFGETGSDAAESIGQTSSSDLEGSASVEIVTYSEGGDASTGGVAENVCGDGVVAGNEECDGPELLGATCESEGYRRGDLSCRLGCTFDTQDCEEFPEPVLTLNFSAIKQFDFSWSAIEGVDYYQLEVSATPSEPFVQLGEDIMGTTVSLTMPLHLRSQARYRLLACSHEGWCVDSAPVGVVGSLAEAIGYFKASNTGEGDYFGYSVALSGDGNTLAVGAYREDSNATGVGGDQDNNDEVYSGAVYVFVRDGNQWSQQAYVKASNTGQGDAFGYSVALSGDGNTLAVGADHEDSDETGVGGDQEVDAFWSSGAVYVFVRDGTQWSQQAYVKASNTRAYDYFGQSVALSGDGNTLAIGAREEDSDAPGVGGDQANDDFPSSGAVYVFVRDGNQWSQQAYVKASNTGPGDEFGVSVALSGDGNTLAVGAHGEGSSATGVGGDQANDDDENSGAVYVFVRDGSQWSQQAYVKASNTGQDDRFGNSIALSGDGNTLAVGALWEDSSTPGVGDNQGNDNRENSGAVYVFVRDGDQWSQQAYVKASNIGQDDRFGHSVALSGDGNILAVGAYEEDSSASGVGGDQGDRSSNSGAAYVFVRDDDQWSQQAYVKASNTALDDRFGYSVALSGDGNTLAVGAYGEDRGATGVGDNQTNDRSENSGAVYLY